MLMIGNMILQTSNVIQVPPFLLQMGVGWSGGGVLIKVPILCVDESDIKLSQIVEQYILGNYYQITNVETHLGTPLLTIQGVGVGRGGIKKNSSTHHKKQRQRSAKLIKLLHITAYNTRIHFELHLRLHSGLKRLR